MHTLKSGSTRASPTRNKLQISAKPHSAACIIVLQRVFCKLVQIPKRPYLMRESFAGALDCKINQRQVSPILSGASHQWFPSQDGVIRHRTGEKCGPAEREQYLMVGTGNLTVREGAIMLQPRALYESQLCNSTLAAEYPSSDRDQQYSRSSVAPEKRSGLTSPKNMPALDERFCSGAIKQAARSANLSVHERNFLAGANDQDFPGTSMGCIQQEYFMRSRVETSA